METLIVPAPAWLLARITAKTSSTSRASDGENKIADGARNATLASLAGTMRRRGMSREAIEAALLAENNLRCDPPLDDDEVKSIAASVARYEPEPETDAAGKAEAESAPLKVVRMADVQAETVAWLWHPYIALGKLTILEGDPGLGKSWLTCALACAVSHGRGIPGAEPFTPGNVLMLSAEDGLGDTLRPRLDAVGADVSRVFALDEPLTFDAGGLLKLEAAIIEFAPVLVIIDPLFAFTGGKVEHPSRE